MIGKTVSVVLAFLLAFAVSVSCAEEELTIFYTGETHAMLYPCNCPVEPDGGIARRAALLDLLRAKYPSSLTVDSGGFFAGGALDEYSQNSELDRQRTEIQVRAMDVMAYDAVCVGDDEFYFGVDYLVKTARAAKTPFLSCTVIEPSGAIKPYLIKEVAGMKIGIIGITPMTASRVAQPLEVVSGVDRVAETVGKLRSSGVQVIVVLSQQSEAQDMALLEQVGDIDVLVTSQSRERKEPYTRVKDSIVLYPSWQGRRIGKASFVFQAGKLRDVTIEQIRLSSQITDDPEITSFLPGCFSDANCRWRGLTAYCAQAGTAEARCELAEAHPVKMQVITSESCVTCHPELVIAELKKHFPLLEVSFVPYPGERAQQLIDFTQAEALPVYLLGEEVETERNFAYLRDNFDRHGPYYKLIPEASGISLFFLRPEEKQRFDLFLRIFDKRTSGLLEVSRKFNPRVHLVIREGAEGFQATGGNLEVEDSLRAVCIERYYPSRFHSYLSCRSQNSESSWWQECADGLETEKIVQCAQSEEGARLLRENIRLTEELKILTAPTYLLNNQQVFSSDQVPSEQELAEVINRLTN